VRIFFDTIELEGFETLEQSLDQARRNFWLVEDFLEELGELQHADLVFQSGEGGFERSCKLLDGGGVQLGLKLLDFKVGD
jgi:hypothetical protein